ncbi:hypothetical protein DM02DRAFT_631176 [Periconia macrospinosa]|uniref:Uncharacterized protein n=1 Tax=Periconia macrospinosa TaxID=97972 RepID=A0A2V1DGW4_9PLEO|nr:hypothetical protein DM02DRAFT_631176 [Periconia macrospinosa]
MSLSTPRAGRPDSDEDVKIYDKFPAAEQLAVFQEHAINGLRKGYNPTTTTHVSGLDELRDNVKKSDEIFGDGTDYPVFSFAPYTAVYDKNDSNYYAETPTGLNAEWDHSGKKAPRGDDGQAQSYNDMIQAELKAILERRRLWNVFFTALLFWTKQVGNMKLRRIKDSKAKWRVFFEKSKHHKEFESEAEIGQKCATEANTAFGLTQDFEIDFDMGSSQDVAAPPMQANINHNAPELASAVKSKMRGRVYPDEKMGY